ncbi:hypothetical protein ABE236_06795 [Priestia endophytica]|uniref:hypothetical protein n=1 Tax=Priestia endophytica TaxID=135735 RepID=UPI003D2D868E
MATANQQSMRRYIASICISTLLMFIFSPLAHAATQDDSLNGEHISEEEMDRIINEIVSEIRKENPELSKETNNFTTMGVASVGTKLIKIFGKGYVKSKLPKKIYSKLPAQAKEKVTEGQFVGAWNTYVLMGPLDEVKDNVTEQLDPYMWHWLASSCGYIAQGVVYALI